jgi:hypothetical protein
MGPRKVVERGENLGSRGDGYTKNVTDVQAGEQMLNYYCTIFMTSSSTPRVSQSIHISSRWTMKPRSRPSIRLPCVRTQMTERQAGVAGYTPDHLLLGSALNLGPLILLGNTQVRKLWKHRCQGFRGSKAFVLANFEFVKFPTR